MSPTTIELRKTKLIWNVIVRRQKKEEGLKSTWDREVAEIDREVKHGKNRKERHKIIKAWFKLILQYNFLLNTILLVNGKPWVIFSQIFKKNV